MSYHIKIPETKCPKCSAIFISFKKNFKCPKCDEPTDDFTDFVLEIIDVMVYHKKRYGQFFPLAWYTGSMANHILGLILRLFDDLEKAEQIDPEQFIISWLQKVKWGKDEYLEKHIRDVALEVYPIYKSEKLSEIKPINKNIFQRIKYWLKSLVP